MVKSTIKIGMILILGIALSSSAFGQTTVNVTFQADLTELISNGFFTVGEDSIFAPGAHNGWTGTPTADQLGQPDLFNPTLLVVTEEVTANVGDTLGWKFRALPAASFGNGGWESGDDRRFEFTGSDIVLDPVVPNISPAGTPLENDVVVQFSVDARTAVDAYNGKPFGNDIVGVFLQGEVTPLGAWGCSWTNDDTSCFQKMYDDGINGGDATADDGIYTGQVIFPSGTPNLSEYKYGIVTAVSDTLNGGVNHLDNEAGFGRNHQTPFIADQAGTFALDTDLFGDIDFENPVTFSVNMNVQQALGNFDPETNFVVVRGSLLSEATGDSIQDWQGNWLKLRESTETPGVYENTVDVSPAGDYAFKYVIIDQANGADYTTQDGTWESISDRMVTVPEGGVVLETVFFDDDEGGGDPVTANVTFQADLSDLINGGFFDAGTDTIFAPGAHNGWTGTPSGDQIGQPDLFNPTLFLITEAVTAVPGDTLAWKFRALPASKFGNGGWEGGDDHRFEFNGSDQTLDAFVPDIGPAGTPLTNDVTVQFAVDVNNATDTYNEEPFGDIIGVFLQGEVDPLGAWGCSWTNDDTSCFRKMYDDGATDGDATAGDGIYTTQVLFPAGTPNLSEYKYGIVAAGSDTLNGGVNPLDNEAGFAQNHQTPFIPDQPGLFVLPVDTWGSERPTAVEDRPTQGIPTSFNLGDNYPNPFNPTTSISYELPKSSRVTLKIYDALGKLIATIVDGQQQSAGSYVVDWDGKNLNGQSAVSGIYLYKIEADNFQMTKKMLLVK